MARHEKKAGIADALTSAYKRVPEFPYLDRATSLILIVCVVGYLGFTAYIYFSTPPVEIEARLLEGSIAKNSQLALMPGEHYAYLVQTPEGSQQVDYFVRASPACKGVVVQERMGQAGEEICILPSGLLADDGVNLNYGNRSILLFSPWMLAASENFSWKVETVYSAHGVEMAVPTYFASKGKQQLAGREAYEIDISDEQDAASASRFFVDSEKRVLLLADMGNLTIRMASAPFDLNWAGQN